MSEAKRSTESSKIINSILPEELSLESLAPKVPALSAFKLTEAAPPNRARRGLFEHMIRTNHAKELFFRDVEENPTKYDKDGQELIEQLRKHPAKELTKQESHTLNLMMYDFVKAPTPAKEVKPAPPAKPSKKEKRPHIIEIGGEKLQPFWWL